MGVSQGTSVTYYLLWLALFLLVVANVAIIIDSQRRKRQVLKRHYNVPVEPLSLYAIVGGLFTVVALLAYLSSVVTFIPQLVPQISFALAPFRFLLVIVYLARVVLDPRVRSYYAHHLEQGQDATQKSQPEPANEESMTESTSKE